LLKAVERAEKGRIDADLGGGVLKQRLARKGQGKSGGFRAIVLHRAAQRAFFVYGYGKSERDNIKSDEKDQSKKAAVYILRLWNQQ
jgi:hypothetical protein